MFKKCTICGNEYYVKKSRLPKTKYCSVKCKIKGQIGKPSWNKGRTGLQVAWNKGKTNVYSKETREKMGLKNRGKHYSPETEFKKGENIGINHRLWKGERASYISIHSWVSRWKGRPSKCENCGVTNKKRYEWANIDGNYFRNLDDYIRLCKSCHTVFDFNRLVEAEVKRRLKIE